MKRNYGITLIALVVTIIVLLILAGVTITLTIGENGIITRANDAKELTRAMAVEEQAEIWKLDVNVANETDKTAISLEEKLKELVEQKLLSKEEAETIKKDFNNSIVIAKKTISFKVERKYNIETANVPVLVDGMTPIKFTEPTDSTMGSVAKTSASDTNWYDYTASKWANAETQDGSMWVWIPRYAYKISYNNPSDKSQGGSIDVKFLIGSTDDYYDENGNRKTAQRAKTAEEDIDTTADYTVHPAFTNESSIGFRNGGWDKEVTGIWVAKFEAGFASGNNSAPVARSNAKYTQTTAYVAATEAGTSADVSQSARNWLDGIYGSNLPNISYPVFQPKTYSMNYISVNDAYIISRSLTDSGNIYGLKKSTADSHLIKNSEWGAVAYLSHSKYGANGEEPTINNATLNSGDTIRTESTSGKTGVVSVYAITGCTNGSSSDKSQKVKIEEINNASGNTPTATGKVYVWNQKTGTKASSTLNITGVYDMSGGVCEREPAYVANENANLKINGESIAYDGNTLKTLSTKYTTVYPHDSSKDNVGVGDNYNSLNAASNANYVKNSKIYGDAILETSSVGTGSTSWNRDCSIFVAVYGPFFLRSGYWDNSTITGNFYFTRNAGDSGYTYGFRSVIIPMI